jgi:hypothetical protein
MTANIDVLEIAGESKAAREAFDKARKDLADKLRDLPHERIFKSDWVRRGDIIQLANDLDPK